MKLLSKTLTTLCGIALIPFAIAAADDPASSSLEELPPVVIKGITIAEMPQPIQSYCPRVSSRCVGKTVTLKFTINEQGMPVSVRPTIPLIAYHTDDERDLACQMNLAVRNWRFQPALDRAGRPTAVRVLLPIKVVEEKEQVRVQVSLRLDPRGNAPS